MNQPASPPEDLEVWTETRHLTPAQNGQTVRLTDGRTGTLLHNSKCHPPYIVLIDDGHPAEPLHVPLQPYDLVHFTDNPTPQAAPAYRLDGDVHDALDLHLLENATVTLDDDDRAHLIAAIESFGILIPHGAVTPELLAQHNGLRTP